MRHLQCWLSCDDCKAETPMFEEWPSAVTWAVRNGWAFLHIDSTEINQRHLCPRCSPTEGAIHA